MMQDINSVFDLGDGVFIGRHLHSCPHSVNLIINQVMKKSILSLLTVTSLVGASEMLMAPANAHQGKCLTKIAGNCVLYDVHTHPRPMENVFQGTHSRKKSPYVKLKLVNKCSRPITFHYQLDLYNRGAKRRVQYFPKQESRLAIVYLGGSETRTLSWKNHKGNGTLRAVNPNVKYSAFTTDGSKLIWGGGGKKLQGNISWKSGTYTYNLTCKGRENRV